MASIYEYQLIFGVSPEQLTVRIARLGEEDWDPFMGSYASIFPSSDIQIFYQMMCRVKAVGMDHVAADVRSQETAESGEKVPETPGEAVSRLEVETMTGKAVMNVRSLFAGILCACFEREGDNPECPIHQSKVS
jgi:hypothetical protein